MTGAEAITGRGDAEAATGRGELPGTQPANVPAAIAPNTPRRLRRDQAAQGTSAKQHHNATGQTGRMRTGQRGGRSAKGFR